MKNDYFLERQLFILNPELHRRYKDCVVTSQLILARYQSIFLEYTDHTLLHTMNVVENCNRLIGNQTKLLSGDDIYVLLMGCLFHDVGMGISRNDFLDFTQRMNKSFSNQDFAKTIREYHQEFSAMFLEKHWELLDIPNEAYLFAITQICRGHRKADLLNAEKYPCHYFVDTERSVCLPYLTALMRLADDLDIVADRNSILIYDIDKITTPISHIEFAKHKAVFLVELNEQTIIIHTKIDDSAVRDGIILLCKKISDTLHYCSMIAATRSEFVITQQNIRLVINGATEII